MKFQQAVDSAFSRMQRARSASHESSHRASAEAQHPVRAD